jgi:hypothetical protein
MSQSKEKAILDRTMTSFFIYGMATPFSQVDTAALVTSHISPN